MEQVELDVPDPMNVRADHILDSGTVEVGALDPPRRAGHEVHFAFGEVEGDCSPCPRDDKFGVGSVQMRAADAVFTRSVDALGEGEGGSEREQRQRGSAENPSSRHVQISATPSGSRTGLANEGFYLGPTK